MSGKRSADNNLQEIEVSAPGMEGMEVTDLYTNKRKVGRPITSERTLARYVWPYIQTIY